MLIRQGDIVLFSNGTKGRVVFKQNREITVIIDGKKYIGPVYQVARNLTLEKYGTDNEMNYRTDDYYKTESGRGVKQAAR